MSPLPQEYEKRDMRLSTRRLLLTDLERRPEVSVPSLEAAGGWDRVFGSPGTLTLEIGLGKDTHLIERAHAEPERRFVGLEYCRKKLDKVLTKIARREGGLENLRVLHADVTRVLEAVFPLASLEQVYVLFPDPWPKKRHHGRRIINPKFLRTLSSRMAPGARLEVRTDDIAYLEQIIETLAGEPALENLVAPRAVLIEPLDADDHVPTLFELKFRERGLPIHYFYFERRG